MNTLRERAVVFPCGSETLVGILHEAAGRTGVLILVGGPQYRVGSHRQFVLMARAFAASGFPVLRFDYRGMGDSGGDPRAFENVADDIRAAIGVFARESAGLEEIVLWGLCDAASGALLCCDVDSRISALILANPWVRNDRAEARSYVKHYYLGRLLQKTFWEKALRGRVDVVAALGEFLRKLVAGVVPAGGSQVHTQSFIERMRAGLERFKGPVLILMSGRDLTAQAFRELASADAGWQRLLARPQVRQLDLPAADHTFSARRELDRASEYCLSWLREPHLLRNAS